MCVSGYMEFQNWDGRQDFFILFSSNFYMGIIVYQDGNIQENPIKIPPKN